MVGSNHASKQRHSFFCGGIVNQHEGEHFFCMQRLLRKSKFCLLPALHCARPALGKKYKRKRGLTPKRMSSRYSPSPEHEIYEEWLPHRSPLLLTNGVCPSFLNEEVDDLPAGQSLEDLHTFPRFKYTINALMLPPASNPPM